MFPILQGCREKIEAEKLFRLACRQFGGAKKKPFYLLCFNALVILGFGGLLFGFWDFFLGT